MQVYFLLQELAFLNKEYSSNKLENDLPFDTINTNKIEFSACLIVRDENHNIPEWLAYHYHMVNLRHVVICVDPFSQSSPIEIAKRWRKQGMTIDVWAEDKFSLPASNITMQKKIDLHRLRQKNCYTDCMEHLKLQNRSWTIMIDVDEYLTFNPIADDGSMRGIGDSKYWKKVNHIDPNSRYNFTKEIENNIDTLMEARTRVPTLPFFNNKTIASYLDEEKNNEPWNSSSCVVLPRVQYGDKVEQDELVIRKGVPKEFDPYSFATLKYFTRNQNYADSINGPGKCILDVSRMRDLAVRNIHRINFKECGSSAFADHLTALLRVNHYVMSKEKFDLKEHHQHNENNKKFHAKSFHGRANVNHGRSYDLQGWLQSFVDCVGLEKAVELLQVDS